MRRTRILAIDHFMKIFRVSEISWFHVIHFARPLVAPPKVMILICSVVCSGDVECNVLMAYGGYHISVQFSLRPVMNWIPGASFLCVFLTLLTRLLRAVPNGGRVGAVLHRARCISKITPKVFSVVFAPSWTRNFDGSGVIKSSLRGIKLRIGPLCTQLYGPDRIRKRHCL